MKQRLDLIFVSISALAVALLLSVTAAHADEHIEATIGSDRTELSVGDVVQLTLRVEHPSGYRLVPVQLGQSWGELEVRSVSEVEKKPSENGAAFSSQTIEVSLWAPGVYETPELITTLIDGEGEPQELTIPPFTLQVNSVLVEGDEELRDIKPQASLPLPPLWPWIAGAILSLALIAFVVSRLAKRRGALGQAAPVDLPDLRPAYLIALEELERIERLNLPSQGRFKSHYTLVTDVIRQYLESAFQVPAMDRTTAEIRQRIKQVDLPRPERNDMLSLLGEADLVKFAKVIPELDLARNFPLQARRFVEATHPVIPVMETQTNKDEVMA